MVSKCEVGKTLIPPIEKGQYGLAGLLLIFWPPDGDAIMMYLKGTGCPDADNFEAHVIKRGQLVMFLRSCKCFTFYPKGFISSEQGLEACMQHNWHV